MKTICLWCGNDHNGKVPEECAWYAEDVALIVPIRGWPAREPIAPMPAINRLEIRNDR